MNSIFPFRWKRINALALMCPKVLALISSSKKVQIEHKFIDETIHTVIRSMSPSLGKTFSGFSEFLERNRAHSVFYTPLWTDEGLCFSFNTLNSRDVYTEK